MHADAELQVWQEWGARCALGLLETEGRAQLTTVIAQRFVTCLRRANLALGRQIAAPTPADCAHFFELHCALHQRRDGKRYKDWLLQRGRGDLDTVQSGVMLLCRNVVRDWLRQDHPVGGPISLQQPPPGFPNAPPLEQLLPAPADDPAPGEWGEWRERVLPAWREELHPRELTLLILRRQGRIFSDPAVRRETGYGKSALHQSQRELLHRVASRIQEAFPDLEPAVGAARVLEILDRLGEWILSDINAEKDEIPAFVRVETPQ